ncbi:MAG: protein-glutamate O-methyltransferase [Phycisphaerae bacterium]|jgi:chemotaxis protein methyltransferase CheR
MSTVETYADLTREEYELVRRLVYEQCGINLGDQKMQLVRARLGKRVRSGGFKSYRAYLEHVRNDSSGRELGELIDAISTNTTHLFREKQHFDFLADALRQWASDPKWRRDHRDVRIWSAACSSGEEPYSIVMTACDAIPPQAQLPLKILATDISSQVLEKARHGVFDAHRLGTVPESYRRRFLTPIGRGREAACQVKEELRRLITFARFNLMADQFPFRQKFDVIFCRNVMIYFDRPTQQTLVNKMTQHLNPGGYLLIGHSESLNPISHSLSYVRPTVYQRPRS